MTSGPRRDLHEQNRRSWNEATRAHNSHKGDQARFFRDGGSTLFPEEVELLGDLSGKALVHLQCNAGQDSLSLARLGALVTGVDISDEAIEFARLLSRDSGIAAEFVRADVYDWLREAAAGSPRFDIAFSSYGALVWLSDLAAWAKGIAASLAPAGRLVVVDFHPFASTFETDWRHLYPYFGGGQATTWEEGIGDYVAAAGEALVPWGYEEGTVAFKNPHASSEFTWTVGDMVEAVLGAGLRLETFREYPYSNGARQFEGMAEGHGRRFYPPAYVPSLPLMFGFSARR